MGESHFLFQKSFCTHHPLNLHAGAASSVLAQDCSCYLPPRGYRTHPKLYSWEHFQIRLCKHRKKSWQKGGVFTSAPVTAHWAMSSPTRSCRRTKGWSWRAKPHPPVSPSVSQASPTHVRAHLGQARVLLIAFPLFSSLPPSPYSKVLSLKASSRFTP